MEKEKKPKIGIKLYIVLFFIIYALLQIGFTGLYTYTTFGALVTCLMYFSVYTVFTVIYVLFKFRKNEENKKNKTVILNRIFTATIVIILLATVVQIYNYFYNMNGMIALKDEYEIYTEYNGNGKIENIVENTIDTSDELNVFQDMLEYNAYTTKIDSLYNGMKEKAGMFIFIRLIVDCIDIAISAFAIFIVSNTVISIFCKRKVEKESIEEKVVDGESK